jgi:23S rRNA (adenine2030-N6)-methyltransferase
MLSYQHAYHAGNPADLHKHLVLAGLLGLLTRKARGLSYMETHAGRGRYDLTAPEALKTGEAAEGIGALTLPDCPLATALHSTRARFGSAAYPGSPLIAQTLLRSQDRLHLMELHPAEFRALRRHLRSDNTHVHHRDGYEGVLALSPPRPRKGLVLVDPSYEVKTEYGQVAGFTHKLMAKWPEATVMIWYPILPAGRHQELVAALKLKFLRHEVRFDLKDGEGMTGSGLVLVNAPYGAEKCLADAVKLAQPILAGP